MHVEVWRFACGNEDVIQYNDNDNDNMVLFRNALLWSNLSSQTWC